MPENTHLVIRTGIARGTTRVMIADSTVVTTISAPTTKASHASTVVPTASLLPPSVAPLVAATGGRQHPGRLPARSRGTHTRFPPTPARCATRSSSRPHHSGRPGSGSPLEGMPASASTSRTLEASSGVRKFPSRRRGVPGGMLPDPSSIPGSSHRRLGRRPGLPTMFPAQAASLGNREASPSLVYGARLLSGFGVHPPSCVRIALPPLCAASSTDRAPDYGSGGWGFESSRRAPKPQVSGLGLIALLVPVVVRWQSFAPQQRTNGYRRPRDPAARQEHSGHGLRT